MKKGLSLLIVLLFAITAVAGCGTGADAPADQDGLRVALLLPGTVDDGGWNAAAYEGLLLIESELGAEISYSEQVAISDFDEVFRLYASEGYDVVLGHGAEFADAAKRVAPEFPDTHFAINSSDAVQEPNVSSILNDSFSQGFLSGVVAAVVSETGTVGIIGGMEIPSISASVDGYEVGARYIDENIRVLSTFLGNFDDAAGAKELARSMNNQGADIIMHNANQAGMGVMEAAEEEGFYVIGSIGDQANLSPNTIITSGLADMPGAMKVFVEMFLSGDLEAGNYLMGPREGIISLAPFYEFEDILTEEQKSTIREIEAQVISGELDPWDFR